jgi:hypothetical protein
MTVIHQGGKAFPYLASGIADPALPLGVFFGAAPGMVCQNIDKVIYVHIGRPVLACIGSQDGVQVGVLGHFFIIPIKAVYGNILEYKAPVVYSMRMRMRIMGKFLGIIMTVFSLGACEGFPDFGVYFRVFSGGTARMKLSGVRAPLNEKTPVRPAMPQAILLRQEAVPGIPGFGDNAFPAIYGTYYLETPDRPLPEGTGDSGAPAPDFSVWVSPMAMYYDMGLWTGLPRINNFEAREQRPEGGRLIALTVDAPPGGLWTAVFSFTGAAVPGPGEQTRIMAVWTSRFTYFLSLRRVASDVSLPAVLGL